jgi:hypothetical protein
MLLVRATRADKNKDSGPTVAINPVRRACPCARIRNRRAPGPGFIAIGRRVSATSCLEVSYEFRVIDSAGRDSHLDLPLVDRKAMIRSGRAWRMWPVI